MFASTIAAFYYLRVVKIVYFDEPARRFETSALEIRGVMYASLVFVLLFFVFAGPLIGAADAAALSLLLF